MISIKFQFETQYGVFSDALHLPDDHTLTDDEIQAMKQQRLDNWVGVVSAQSNRNHTFTDDEIQAMRRQWRIDYGVDIASALPDEEVTPIAGG